MLSWLMLMAIFAVWLLWAFAAVLQKAVEQRRRGVPEDERHGGSIAPVIPVFPLVLWGTAKLIDSVAGPWGTVVIGSLHAVLAVALTVSIWRDSCRLRSLDKRA